MSTTETNTMTALSNEELAAYEYMTKKNKTFNHDEQYMIELFQQAQRKLAPQPPIEKRNRFAGLKNYKVKGPKIVDYGWIDHLTDDMMSQAYGALRPECTIHVVSVNGKYEMQDIRPYFEGDERLCWDPFFNPSDFWEEYYNSSEEEPEKETDDQLLDRVIAENLEYWKEIQQCADRDHYEVDLETQCTAERQDVQCTRRAVKGTQKCMMHTKNACTHCGEAYWVNVPRKGWVSAIYPHSEPRLKTKFSQAKKIAWLRKNFPKDDAEWLEWEQKVWQQRCGRKEKAISKRLPTRTCHAWPTHNDQVVKDSHPEENVQIGNFTIEMGALGETISSALKEAKAEGLKVDMKHKIAGMDELLSLLKMEHATWYNLIAEIGFMFAHMKQSNWSMAGVLTSLLHFVKATVKDLELVPTACEAISNYWNENAQAGGSGSILAALLTVICVVLIGKMPEEKSITTFITRFSRIGSCIKSFEDIKDRAGSFAEPLTKYLYDCLGIKYSATESDTVLMDEWCEKVEEFMKVSTENDLHGNEEMAMKVDVLIQRGNRLQKDLESFKFTPFQLSHFQRTMQFLMQMRSQASGGGIGMHEPRVGAGIVHFVGDTAVGKSMMTHLLNAHLLSSFGYTDAADVSKLIYWRDANQERFDGYANDMQGLVLDDFGSRKDTASNPSNEPIELIRYGNSAIWQLPMAHLSEKGRTFFRAKWVILTSNRVFFSWDSMTNPDAVARRIDLRFKQEVHPDFVLVRVFDGRECNTLDQEKAMEAIKKDPSNFQRMWVFQELDPTDDTGTRVLKKDLTFEQMAERVSKHIHNKQDAGKIQLKLVEEFLKTRQPNTESKVEAVWRSNGTLELNVPEANQSLAVKLGLVNPLVDVQKVLEEADGKHIRADLPSLKGLHHERILFKRSVRVPAKDLLAFQHALKCAFMSQIHLFGTENTHRMLKDAHDNDAELTTFNGVFQALYPGSYELPLDDVKPKISKKHITEALCCGLRVIRSSLEKIFEWLKQSKAVHFILKVVALTAASTLLTKYVVTPAHAWIWENIFPNALQRYKNYTGVHPATWEPVSEKNVFQTFKDAMDGTAKTVDKDGNVIFDPTLQESQQDKTIGSKPITVESHQDKTQGPKAIPVESHQEKTQGNKSYAVESGSDINAEEITKKVFRNLYRVDKLKDNGFIALGNAVIITGRMLLMNAHVARQCTGRVRLTNNNFVYEFEFPVDKVTQSDQDIHYRKDAVVVELPRDVPLHPRILDYFQTKADYALFRAYAKIALVGLEVPDVIGYHPTKEIRYTTKNTTVDDVFELRENGHPNVYVRNGLKYDIETRKGDCGAVAVTYDRNCERKIVGIHMAGDHATSEYRGVACTLHREFITELLEQARRQHKVEFPESIISNTAVLPNSQSGAIKGYVRHEGEYKMFTPSATNIHPSKLHRVITEPTTKPAHLKAFKNNEGIRIDPLEMAKKKALTPNVELSNDDVLRASANYRTLLHANTDPNDQRVLSTEEAIAGIPGREFYEGIKRQTSPGFGWDKSGKGKTRWLGEDEYITDHPDIIRALCQMEARLRNGQRSGTIWTDTLKDERRPIEKVDQGKTRLFAAGEMSYLILFRRYFMGYAAHMSKNRIDLESCIGLNPLGLDWTRLANRLHEVGDNIIAGDFTNYDGTLSGHLLWQCLDDINEWYGGTEEESQMRRMLWLDIVHSIHITSTSGPMAEIIEWSHSQPSGCPITAILNSHYHSLAARYAYIQCARKFCPEMVGLSNFNRFIRHANFGDDDLYSVHQEIAEWFNQENLTTAFKTLGMTYTDEAKTGVARKHRSLSEVAFLKRGFIWDVAQHRYRAPLALETIFEMAMWVKGKKNLDEITRDTLEEAVYELSQHARNVFETHISKFQGATQRLSSRATLMTFSEYQEIDYNRCFQARRNHVIGAVVNSPKDDDSKFCCGGN